MKMKVSCLLIAWLAFWSCGASSRSAQAQQADTVSFVQLEFNVPARLKATALEVHSLEVKPILLSKELDKLSGSVSVTDSLSSPENGPMVVFVQMDDGSLWTARLESGESIGTQSRRYTFDPVKLEPNPVSSEIRAESVRQVFMNVPSGEYSGITHVKDDVYAVVHDKGSGGGIHLFKIPITSASVVQDISSMEVPGNADGPSGRDNEDIVYVPSSGTLFVSSEGDQSIREYTIEGAPTGRSLTIPADLADIQPNAGFEALAFDAANGFFWAATEKSLSTEGLHRNILRLQRFNAETLEPDARYLYIMENPVIADSQSSSASAYVHGLSAMTVLEDGRLVMLEREVYVPGGSVIEKALGAFTLSTLYVVDPLHDKGGILEKKLLTRVVTSALNLANYEGICLGPKLSGGRQSLLLIADSQNGQGGLTGEYLQLLAIRP